MASTTDLVERWHRDLQEGDSAIFRRECCKAAKCQDERKGVGFRIELWQDERCRLILPTRGGGGRVRQGPEWNGMDGAIR